MELYLFEKVDFFHGGGKKMMRKWFGILFFLNQKSILPYISHHMIFLADLIYNMVP